ncbi:MAG TPA: RNA polymerase sigma factor [Bacteroidetes bacterium]|nr:RNA polymerase sigma factor [Bacteroidota bacterium]
MPVTKQICDSLSDKEIISRSIEDVEYFRCIYERYEKKLKRYIFQISNFSEDEAEDILQNAFIKIWKNINGYDETIKFSSFLYRIVHNETISLWRKKQTLDKVKENYSHEVGDENEFELKEKPTKNQKILDVLNLLSEKYKEVLVLKFLENMDYEEISDILRIPEGTVATRINRAKKAFAKIVKSENIVNELLN